MRFHAQDNIEIFEHHMAIELITRARLEQNIAPGSDEDEALGLYVLDHKTQKVETIVGRIILMATGGAGKVYLYTSNPDTATGDGVAVAYRAGAKNCQYGVFPVSSHLSFSPASKIVSHIGNGTRRGGNSASAKWSDVYGELSFHGVSGSS